MAAKKKKKQKQAPPDLGAPRMIRMSDDLVDRIRIYKQNLSDKHGLEVNFSSVVRSLIEKGLEA